MLPAPFSSLQLGEIGKGRAAGQRQDYERTCPWRQRQGRGGGKVLIGFAKAISKLQIDDHRELSLEAFYDTPIGAGRVELGLSCCAYPLGVCIISGL